MSARKRLLRWANGFALANAALLAVVGLRYLWYYSPLAPLVGWAYAGLAFVGHLSALAYIPLLLLVPVMLLIPWPRLVLPLAVLLASVLLSFLVESALIALVGGVIGILLALPINGIVTSTTNWASFSEVAFAFRVTPRLLLEGVIFAVVMGVVGGFFPARRASRMPVVQALR